MVSLCALLERGIPVSRYDLDEVRLALRAAPRDVFSRLGIDARGRHELEAKSCATSQHSRRRSFVADPATGLWRCFPCGTGGDLLDLIALHHRKDLRRDFGEVIEIAAQIAGVQPISDDPAEAVRRRRHVDERRVEEGRRAAAEHERAAKRRADSIARAAALWPALATSHPEGERYLRGRRIAPSTAAKYDDFGNVAVALYASDGSVRNVVTRLIDPTDDRRVLGMPGCPTLGTLGHSIADVGRGDDVIITEGLADTLTAISVWPFAIVLGAHGADNLPAIAAVAAARVHGVRGRLLLVPHADDAGERAAIAAGRAALAAGLRLDRDLLVVDLDGANDLNEAWCGDWRPDAHFSKNEHVEIGACRSPVQLRDVDSRCPDAESPDAQRRLSTWTRGAA